MLHRDVKLALYIAWTTLSVIIFVMLATPFFIPGDRILSSLPECEYKAKYGTECFMCGTSTAFVYISQGKFDDALSANKYSIYLYLALVINEILFISAILYKVLRKWQYRRNQESKEKINE